MLRNNRSGTRHRQLADNGLPAVRSHIPWTGRLPGCSGVITVRGLGIYLEKPLKIQPGFGILVPQDSLSSVENSFMEGRRSLRT